MRLSSPKLPSPNFFGFAEHGNFESKDPITYLPTATNGDPTYYFFNNFTLHKDHILTTSENCRGLYIYVKDTAIVDGTITMTQKGIYSPPTGEYENGYIPLGLNSVVTNNGIYSIGLPGSSIINSIRNGSNGVDGSCGAGGRGGLSTVGSGGGGGCPGVFSSGSGGCGSSYERSYVVGLDGEDYGGAGGRGVYTHHYCGYITTPSGMGNPQPYYNSSKGWLYDSTINYCAGCLFFISNELQLLNKHLFSSDGIDSNTKSGRTSCSQGTAGHSWYASGATGGGSITITYRRLIGMNFNYSVANGKNDQNLTSGKGSFRSYQIL